MLPDHGLFPLDDYNRELVDRVHPPDWVNPEPVSRYNLVVLGAGTAGLVTAAAAAALGAKVALVERNLMGGDCLNFGCVPSKTLIRSSRAAFEIQQAREFGIGNGSPVNVCFEKVMQRVRRLRTQISQHDSAERFSSLGIDVFLGQAVFSGPDSVTVDGKTLHFRKAVIATGARPVEPPIEGLSDSGFLTNLTLFNLTQLPRHLLIVGGGPIGCEMAQAFRRLGSEVTMAEMSHQFLVREDEDAAALLLKAFKKEGIHLRLQTRVTRVEACDGAKKVTLENNSGAESIGVDEILVSVGRLPNVEGLDLEKAGVDYGSKGVIVNERLQTSNPRIYAAGDVCLDYKFTHTADAAARIVVQNALFLGRKKVSALTIPWCTYTDPEIAHVGLNEKSAAQKGVELDTIRIPFQSVDRAITDGGEDGFLKVHLKKNSDRIMGATIVARHAGEFLSEISLAMTMGIGLGKISSVIHPYPTQAEAIRKAADTYNRTRLTPLVKKVFSYWLRWSR